MKELDRQLISRVLIFVLMVALNFALPGKAICSARDANSPSQRQLMANRALLKLWLSVGTVPFSVDKQKAVAVTTSELDAALAKGADVNASSHGMTALTAAAYSGNVDCVKLLIARGADVNLRSRYGTPLFVAAWGGEIACINILLAHSANIHAWDDAAFDGAIDGGNVDCVRYFISKGFSPSAENKTGATPLEMACIFGRYNVARFLISHGANVNDQDSGRGTTALMHAALADEVDLVKLLISNGADVNISTGPIIKGPHGEVPLTALRCARMSGDNKMIAILKAAGAR